jgi:two-component system chemotaxis response regulator CheB
VTRRDIVVIGGSAGGIHALRSLVAELSPKWNATLFVVIHISPDSPGLLPEILTREGPLPAAPAANGERFAPGRIYVAPPDRHLLLEAGGFMRLTCGPRENRSRPAIDPLFRSAALAYGPRVVGVLLSGGLDDGVAGLGAIKSTGGFTIVQDPEEAEVESMPCNALRQVAIDRIARVRQIAFLLGELSQGKQPGRARPDEIEAMSNKELEIEVRQSQEKEGYRPDIMELGNPSMLACPECHGTLLRLNDQQVLRFRCHTGHAFTANSLLAAIKERIEEALWTSLSAIEESAMLLGHMANHLPRERDGATSETFRHASEEALGRAQAVRAIIGDGRDKLPVPAMREAE